MSDLLDKSDEGVLSVMLDGQSWRWGVGGDRPFNYTNWLFHDGANLDA